MAIPPIQVNYPRTTFSFTDASSNLATLSAAELVVPSITTNVIVDSASSTGTSGQYLISNASSEIQWASGAGWLVGDATGDLNMNSYNITNGQGLTLQTNTSMAELVVTDDTGANEVQIIPTQISVVGSTNSTVILQDGYDCLIDGDTVITYDNGGITTYNSVFDLSVNQLTLAGVSGAAGQVIKLNASGAPVWGNDADMQSIANVITNGSNASGLSITNLSSIQLSNNNGSTNCQLSAIGDVLRLETAPDMSGGTKSFARGYLPIYISSQIYYLPLYSVAI
jgi:hypothetical protein